VRGAGQRARVAPPRTLPVQGCMRARQRASAVQDAGGGRRTAEARVCEPAARGTPLVVGSILKRDLWLVHKFCRGQTLEYSLWPIFDSLAIAPNLLMH